MMTTQDEAVRLDRAERMYDTAREDAAKATWAMVEAHDRWSTAAGALDHPVTRKITQRRWDAFQLKNDEWQQAMAALKVARRRWEKLRS